MSYCLRGLRQKASIKVSRSGWLDILRLALDEGWKPTGTVNSISVHAETDEEQEEFRKEWDGTYFGNFHYQTVVDEDARRLARHLCRAIVRMGFSKDVERRTQLPSTDPAFIAVDWSKGDSRKHLVNLLEFLEVGCFFIS